MKRIIITAILTVICVVGAATSFVVNDLPNFGQWMQTNEAQFKSHKGDKDRGPDGQKIKKDKSDKHDDRDKDDKRKDRDRRGPEAPMNGQNAPAPAPGQPGPQPAGQPGAQPPAQPGPQPAVQGQPAPPAPAADSGQPVQQ